MLIKISPFGGEVPRLDSRMLKDYNATTAINTRLYSGSLRSWRSPKQLEAVQGAGTESFYLYHDHDHPTGAKWLEWANDVNVVKSQIADDAVERIYYTGDGVPKFTDNIQAFSGVGAYPHAETILGVPAPALAPTLAHADESLTVFEIDNLLGAAPPDSPSVSLPVTTTGERVRFNIKATVSVVTIGRGIGDIFLKVFRDGDEIHQVKTPFTSAGSAGSSFDFNAVIEDYGSNTDSPPAGINTYTATVTAALRTTGGSGDFSVFTGAIADLTSTINTFEVVNADFVRLRLSPGHGLTESNKIRVVSLPGIFYGQTPDYQPLPGGGVQQILSSFVPEFDIDSVEGDWITVAALFSGAMIGTGTIKPIWTDKQLEDRVYVYTYLVESNGLVMEGQPSLPSEIIQSGEAQSITVSGFSAAPAGFNVTGIRIYRSKKGSGEAVDYFYVDEIALITSEYIDKKRGAELNEPLSTLYYSLPPDDMQGLIDLPEGVMAGFSGKQICFSEPYYPHAYPIIYRQSTVADVVALAHFGSSTAVLTKGRPYVINGRDPATMSMEHLEVSQSCVSKKGVVDMGYGIVYPSPDGLVYISGQSVKVVTEQLFKKEEWQKFNPSTMQAALYDERYVVIFDCDGVCDGFIFDPKEPLASLTMLNLGAERLWTEPESGDLYFIKESNFYRFDDSVLRMQYRWKSKTFKMRREINVGLAQVHADKYPVRCRIYANDTMIIDKKVLDAEPFNLPSGFLAREWQMEFIGDSDINAAYLASDMDSLANAV